MAIIVDHTVSCNGIMLLGNVKDPEGSYRVAFQGHNGNEQSYEISCLSN